MVTLAPMSPLADTAVTVKDTASRYTARCTGSNRLVKVNDPDYAPMDTDEGYINFELVHDPGEDKMANTYSYYGWISWDLQAYNLIYENEDLATAKGVIVGMTNLQGKKVYYRAKFMD